MHIGEKIESFQINTGYGVAAGIGTVPYWVHELSGWLQFGAVIFAFLVGLSTFYLNMMRIGERRRKDKEGEDRD